MLKQTEFGLFAEPSTEVVAEAQSKPAVKSKIAPVPAIKATKSRKGYPSFVTSVKQSEAVLRSEDLQLANTNILDLRAERTSNATLNKLAKASPDLSAAVAAPSRLSISSEYTLLVKNTDGTINPEGVLLGQQLIRRFNFLHPTGTGFNPYRSLRSVSESLARELMLYGACSLELVLNSARIPEGLVPISTTQIKFRSKQKRLVPFQEVGGDEISLDIPTFFYVSLDQDLLTAYPDPPMQSAMQPLIAFNDFMNDIRRIFRKAIHPRQVVSIDEDKFRARIPPDILHDSEKLEVYMNTIVSDLEGKLQGLSPEDALVIFDTLDYSIKANENPALANEYKTLGGILEAKTAAGTKSAGIVLNHSSAASQNIASTSSMLYVKSVEGSVQQKLNEIFSRVFTQAIRLFGLDVVSEFEFKPIDLRPKLELETFKAVRQSRVLEQLSLGLVEDMEASILLTGTVPPPGMKPLSGTRFSSGKSDTGNPNSNTSQGQGSALNQNLKSDSPDGVKSKNRGNE